MKKTIALVLVLLLAVPFGQAIAAKKEKPKPYKSETVSTGIPHPDFYHQFGEVITITGKEFEATCSTPLSQGLDAWVFEVPARFQKIASFVKAIGEPGGLVGYDLDLGLFDDSCDLTVAMNFAGTDASGSMPAGTAWILIHNNVGGPNTQAHIEISAL